MESRRHSRTPSPTPETSAARPRLESATAQFSVFSRRSSVEQRRVEDADVRVTQSEFRAVDTTTASTSQEPTCVTINRTSEISMSVVGLQQQSFASLNIEQEMPSDTTRTPRAQRGHQVLENIMISLLRFWLYISRRSNNSTQVRTPPMDIRDISNVLYGGNLPEQLELLCEICIRGAEMGPLIVPCQCRDPTRSVHAYCLMQHIELTNQHQCSNCNSDYTVTVESQRTINVYGVFLLIITGFLIGYFLIYTIFTSFSK